jgi:hypothetical protein
MKYLKSGLRFWITIASVLSFVGGWIMLVHAPKPDQSSSIQNAITNTRPTLEPLPPLPNSGDDEVRQSGPGFFDVQPRLRTQSNPFFVTGGS